MSHASENFCEKSFTNEYCQLAIVYGISTFPNNFQHMQKYSSQKLLVIQYHYTKGHTCIRSRLNRFQCVYVCVFAPQSIHLVGFLRT